jgi:DNA-binding transcriptional LysR family regulator
MYTIGPTDAWRISMLDGVSLDQLRTFIASVDEGSFSAASRKLLRAQSVVSDTIRNLEEQIRVALFDRSGRYPKLTPAGAALLADARSIVTGVDLLKARAKGMSAGLEPELSLVIDVFYPMDAITQVAKEFRKQYPGVSLRIYVEALGAAIQPVLDGRCSIGVIGSLPEVPDTLSSERLPSVAFFMVASRDHPLSAYKKKIPKEVLAHRPVATILRPRVWCHVTDHLAACGPVGQTSVFTQRTGLGRDAVACGARGPGGRTPLCSADRGCAARRVDTLHVGGVANQGPARACRPLVY